MAHGQTYFAIQTRKQEITELEYSRLTEDEKRLYTRILVNNKNKYLFKTARETGVENFGKFNNYGYKGLYNGETAKEIAKRKNIKVNEDILDYMGSEELGANLFRITQTEAKLKKDYYNILEKSGLYNHVKTINCFLYMLDKNDLYSTALMKNMFALDFYFNKTYNAPITSLHYAKAPFGPIIDNHDEIINYLINNGYISLMLNYDNMFTEKELNSMRYVKDKLLGKSSVSLSDWSHKFIGWKETKN